jgi:hypothetical protein
MHKVAARLKANIANDNRRRNLPDFIVFPIVGPVESGNITE